MKQKFSVNPQVSDLHEIADIYMTDLGVLDQAEQDHPAPPPPPPPPLPPLSSLHSKRRDQQQLQQQHHNSFNVQLLPQRLSSVLSHAAATAVSTGGRDRTVRHYGYVVCIMPPSFLFDF